MAEKTLERKVTLWGRIIITGNIRAVTGLHIGGAAGALEIGGVDSPVIRNPLDNQPYIPGSSVRGKMRSLTERWHGSEQNFPVGKAKGKEVFVHTCRAGDPSKDDDMMQAWRDGYKAKFSACPVCSVFGVTGDEPVPHPTSLIVRDVFLSKQSAAKLEKAGDFPFTEIKWEATIDRVTSAATPRQIERVPAGAMFEGFELVFGIYDRSGVTHFAKVLEALQLVEEDYLGGLGSRGGGKVEFHLTSVYARSGKNYERTPFGLPPAAATREGETPVVRITDDVVAAMKEWVEDTFRDVTD